MKHPRIDSGFALIGVVMFVLVLTILGLSLFSLSSFEAQFFTQSTSQAEAFAAASDGMERARFVLAATESLGAVKGWVTGGLIVNAVAKQGNVGFASPESLARVQWNGDDITIRVLAIQRGQRSLLEARYRPIKPEDYYKRLMTLSGDLTIIPAAPIGGGPSEPRITVLQGEIWKNGSNPVTCAGVHPLRPGGGVSAPDIGSYLASPATPVVDIDPTTGPTGTDHWILSASGSYTVFTTPSAGANYSIESSAGNVRVDVSGTAVWLLDRGFRADDEVKVSGGLGSALIIVAGKTAITGPDAERGFNLLGGMSSTIPVVLVTDGICGIEHKNNNARGTSLLPLVSIYARDVVLMGSGAPGSQTLIYPSALDPILDVLRGLGLLPNMPAGGDADLPPVAGTWRDITESNPS
jgi:hypothetical protein